MRTRGCNGLSYVMEYATEKGKLDEEVVQDGKLSITYMHCYTMPCMCISVQRKDYLTCVAGVRVFVDKKAQLTLLGTEMDYVESKLAREFIFNNPNAKGLCGCGESFHV